MTANTANTASLVGKIAYNFSGLMDVANDEPVQTSIRKKSQSLKKAHGWGDKYIEPVELTGERWSAAFSEAREFVAKGGIIAFLGGRGSGKTQMAAEIARAGDFHADSGEWNGNRETFARTPLYQRAMDIFLALRAASKRDSDTSEKAVMDSLIKPGLLVIDEFQERGETEWESRIMSNLVDRRYADEKPTILIANLSREDMAKALSDSIRDRIRENGKAIIFGWESYRKSKP